MSHIKLEISELLISWYKEAKEVVIPLYLFYDEERDKATYWDQKAIEYVTKVLYHVVIDLLLRKKETELINCEKSNLEDFCVNWDGMNNKISLENTCSVDNLITMVSLNLIQIKDTIAKRGMRVNRDTV